MTGAESIFSIADERAFDRAALETFRFQAECCEPYREYVRQLGIRPEEVESVGGIPFLPIGFFKSRRVYCGPGEPQQVFTSSSTSGQVPSKHYVADLSLYEQAFTRAFEQFYGPAERTAVFYANSRYPGRAVRLLCVAARDASGELTKRPVAPCGACRQVLLEAEARAGVPMGVMLYGTEGACFVASARDLLPLSFDESYLGCGEQPDHPNTP